MLRALVAALLLANLVFWAWSAGALDGIGLGPARERDPDRLALQVRPEAVRVLQPAAAAAALAAASAPRIDSGAERSSWVCLEAGPFSAAAVEAAERALANAALPVGAWVRTSHDLTAQYGVVLGPFANAEALSKKRSELGQKKITIEAVDLPANGAPGKPKAGLALGRYESRAAADAALAGFRQRGVTTAHLVQLRPASSENRLRVENASPAQAEQLRTLSAVALGAGFAPCAATPSSR